MSLCLLLALSLVSHAAASPAPALLLASGPECSSPAPALAPAFAAEPRSALGPLDSPFESFGPSPLGLGGSAKVCNVRCTGNPSCLCLNGTHGTCVSGECTPL